MTAARRPHPDDLALPSQVGVSSRSAGGNDRGDTVFHPNIGGPHANRPALRVRPDRIVGAFVSRHFVPGGGLPPTPTERAWRWRGASDELVPTAPIEIERYDGPLFISHGENDTVWSADRPRRLTARLRAVGRTPEVHIYQREDHVLRSETESTHNAQLVDFFARTLTVNATIGSGGGCWWGCHRARGRSPESRVSGRP